eukprot:TRINITY_DN32130_c0_g1_i1.p1 TRINITY_DN32130_c0_g1~~TRINITY_DN32130_c0_g1_i1.p1  ORF type:complete len:656 (+),score=134.28 TRINITY_DN32130_c0_g1_i1:79-2046(+)
MAEIECVVSSSEATETSDSDDSLKHDRAPVPLKAVVSILFIEMCERMTYYTIAGTQKFYMQNKLGKAPSTAVVINSVFSMMCYMWALPGGLLADGIGRYKTILMAGVIYCVGCLAVGAAVVQGQQVRLEWLFLVGSLIFIPIGTGLIKPNIATFGAEQFGDNTPEEKQMRTQFFSWFYLSINIGVLVSFGFLANTTTNGLGKWVDPQHGYTFAYGFGAIVMFLAMGAYLFSTPLYKKVAASGTRPFRDLVSYVAYSATNGGGWRAKMAMVGWLMLPIFFALTIFSALVDAPESHSTGTFVDPCAATPTVIYSNSSALVGDDEPASNSLTLSQVMSEVAVVAGCIAVVSLCVANLNTSWLKKATNRPEGGLELQDARKAFSVVPILIILNLSFNLAYNAMNNAFASSACEMDLVFGPGQQFNGAFFTLADAMAIVFLAPLFELGLYPLIGKLKGSPVRRSQKIIAGLLVAGASNMSAAWLEMHRRKAPYQCGPDAQFSRCAPGYTDDGLQGTRMKDMNAAWVSIPYGLMGMAEILVNPCIYALAYDEAPLQVRSLMQAFSLFCNGCLSNAFTASVSSALFPNNLEQGHLEYFYYANTGGAFLGIILYALALRQSKDSERQENMHNVKVEQTEPVELAAESEEQPEDNGEHPATAQC